LQLKGFTIKYCPESIIYHKHRPTLKGLIRQLYGYGVGYARLHKKYPKYFNPSRRIRNLSVRLLRKIIVAPIKLFIALKDEDKKFNICEPFLDIIALTSLLLGIIKEDYSKKEYIGEVVNERIEFIERAKLPNGWGL
jgi:GT2 family glycosyltransferase